MNETMLERRFSLAQVSLFVAMGYFLTGLLGQLIAIPPGYATLFWPASGLALGSCLIWGRKALPGIYIGSFSINVYIAYASQSEIHLFLPCLIAASAVLQAFVGAALVNRFVGFPFAFHSPQKVLHFALLGGPVSSFINATLSCFVLFFFGALDEHHLLVNWFHWWMGDSLGVVFTFPWLLILFPHLSRAKLPRRQLLFFLLLMITTVVVLFSVAIASFEQKKQVEQFNRNADLLSQSMQAEVDAAIDILYSLRGFVVSHPGLTPRRFQQYTKPILEREAGLQGLSWNAVVGGEQLSDFSQTMSHLYQEEGIAYRVTQRNRAGELVDVEPRTKHVVVTFIEPLQSNRQALGYDVYSQAARKHALDRAYSLRSEVATRPIRLLQEKASQAGVLIFLPVFSDESDQLMGYATAVLRVGDMAKRALSNDLLLGTGLVLFDPAADSDKQVLFALGIDPEELATIKPDALLLESVYPLQRNNMIDVGVDQWALVQNSTSRFISESWSVHILIVFGLIISALFNWFIIIVYGQSYETEQQVIARTGELSNLNVLFNRAQTMGSIGHWEWDINHEKLWWSEEVFHILEQDSTHFIPSIDSLLAAIHPDDRDFVSRAVDGVLYRNEPFAVEHRLVLDNHSEKTVYEEGFVTFDAQNRPVSMFGIIQDITRRKNAEKALEVERQRLEEIIWATNVGTWEWDIIGNSIIINERWADILGYELNDLLPLSRLTWKMLIHQEDQPLFEHLLEEAFSHIKDHYECEYRMRHQQGHWVWVLTRGKVIEWTADGKPKRMSGTQTDITDRKHRDEEVRRLAMTDVLTGLVNRAYYNRRLSETINIAKRNKVPFALLMLDLDGFKEINDGYSHPVGDLVLKDFADLLRHTCRDADVIARIGGDEFIVIMTSLEQAKGAEFLAERLLQQNDAPRVIDGHQLKIGVSIGVGMYTSFTASEEALVKATDKALYAAKSAGKNNYKVLSV